MPELPEVETVRRGVASQVLNVPIKKIDVNYEKTINNNIDDFKKKLTGQKITQIDRRGKYLLFRFTGNLTMVSHLRMEGKYIIEDHNAPMEKHSHVIFEAPKEEIPVLKELVPKVMDSAVDLAVPLKVESASGDTWFDAKK